MFAFMSSRRMLVPVVAALLAPLAAHAQESPLFTWSGRVDREVRLTMRGSQTSNTYENSIQSRARFRVSNALPAQAGTVRVVTESGRGNVEVVQQPDAGNGYTTIVRIVDGEGGADTYRLSAYFTPVNRGYSRGDRGRGVSGRNDDRGRRDDNRGDRREDRGGYGRNLAALHWSGDVDGEVQLIWRGGDIGQRVISGNVVRRASSNVTGNPMSGQASDLQVSVREGRGRVDVIQQPSSSNRYTGIIRILDPEGGYGHYDITVSAR
jgi:hypothetical protein